ncbi:hypothetical protein [Sphingobacterium faecium]|uniref:hypothetical protein n=1 Tax=Sphingobacterium faecium TaxID=34087 RepID=UPI0024686E74|nr:hypothetical protein [Sphingobacterium faecium]MDH5825783.1 hypothetical protein [Sphingobacterium faecium]
MTQEEAKKALNQYLKQEYDQIDLKFRIGRIRELETEGKYKASYTIPLNDNQIFEHLIHFNLVEGKVTDFKRFEVLKYELGVNNLDFNRRSPDQIFDDFKE